MRAPERARRGRPHPSLALLAAAALGCAGCASPLDRTAPETRLAESGAYAMIEGLRVPAVRGVEGCGSQALAAVLAFGDPGADAAAVADALPWHDEGATPVDLLLAARDRGFLAAIERGSWEGLEAHARAGRPVLVMLDASPVVRTLTLRIPTTAVMHWAVVSGVALDGSRLLLAARDARHHVVAREDFLRRWERSDFCAIVVARAPP